MCEPLQWMVKLRGILPTGTWSDCVWGFNGVRGGLMGLGWMLRVREPLQWMVKLRGMLPTGTWSDCVWGLVGFNGVRVEAAGERAPTVDGQATGYVAN